MKRYSGKDIKATIMGLNENGDPSYGGQKFLRGEIKVEMDDKNVLFDNNLDGQQWPAENALAEDKVNGKFSIDLLAAKDNSMSILANNFFNNDVFEASPIYAGKSSGLNETKPNLAFIIGTNPYKSDYYEGFVNELEIDANAEDKFLYMKANGEIVNADKVMSSEFDFSGVSSTTGKPFHVKDITLTEIGTNTELANITKFNLKLKNGTKIVRAVGAMNKSSYAFTGDGEIDVMLDDTTTPFIESYLGNINNLFDLYLTAEDADGNQISIQVFNLKFAKKTPETDRNKSQLITKYTFHILRKDGTPTVEMYL